MINICFVCHGNTCRSPMAKYIFKHLVNLHNLADKFNIMSAGTNAFRTKTMSSYTKEQLIQHHIAFDSHKSTLFTKSIYDNNDYIFVMDDYNISNLPITDYSRVYKLLQFTDQQFLSDNNIQHQNVQDPYGMTDYSNTFNVIYRGCVDILHYLITKHNLNAN